MTITTSTKSKYEAVRALEIAIIDLVTAIQKDTARLDNHVEAVSDAVKLVPDWEIELTEGFKA